jgi:hypothetical protein
MRITHSSNSLDKVFYLGIYLFLGGYGEVKVCKQIDSNEERAVKIINKARMSQK